MSSFKVTVEKLRILEHPNADALELAEVGLYRAVVRKGDYKTGDYALYIPEQAVLPPELIEEFGLTGRLAGSSKDRVKAVRLRGELSQGIVCRPKALAHLWRGGEYEDRSRYEGLMEDIAGTDYAADLGVTKWVPPVPVGMAGQVEPAPNLIPWGDIENIKRYPDIFAPGEQVVVTEKIHGTCFLLTYSRTDGQVWVTSKGQGSKSLALLESDTNLYWRAARYWNLPQVAADLAAYLDQDQVGLFGEVYGKGVQDLHYGADASRDETLGFALFDIAVRSNGVSKFLDAEVWDMALLSVPGDHKRIPTVPLLYAGPYDYEKIASMADNWESVTAKRLHLREGVVVRSAVERRSEVTGGRAIAKFISPAYLTRGGDVTEYE